MQHTRLRLTFLSLIAACGGGGGDGETTAEVVGAATYRDATTDHTGEAQPAAAPPAQSLRVSIVVEGEGTLPEIDPQCALDPAGQFEAHYEGTAELSDGGAYLAGVAGVAATILTPSGCEIPELTVALISDVRVRGELSVTTQNCETYCAASARADAEQSCGVSPTAATCRADAEAAAQASCMTTCSTQTHAIVAEISLGAAALGSLDAAALRAAALGSLEADLVFDHMVDADGNVLEP